ncbi:MAG: PCMD domain-containing protein [Bacteroidales bacterium]|nr:PCMD domain-containing protein [Bacteroidales bacterium]
MKTLATRIFVAAMALGAILLPSCLKNDIPYPRIQANILYISAEGQSRMAQIDSTNRVATLYFPEDANIYEVKIDSFALSPNTTIVEGSLSPDTLIDLSETYFVVLSMYQEYLWRIVSSQDIERYFTVEGQIGTSTIDVPGRRVVATVAARVSLDAVTVETCKLGPTSSVATPELAGHTIDFTSPVVVNISNYGHNEQWTIYITQTESTVETVRVDAWTKVAWVYGQAEASKTNTVQYRIKGDTEWLTVPDSWLTHDGGDFYARLVGLTPLTTYEARAVSDDDYGEEIEFTTGSVVQMPNSDFDNWWLDGKVWNPWAEDGTCYWDTGNKGATTLGQSNSTPTDDTVTGTGQAARLETKFVGIGVIGKLAAGNIFTGYYVRTDGTNGVLSFGREFEERPTKLAGYYKYTTAAISSTTTGFEDLKGRPDTCIIWCALIDTAEPFEIRTNPNNRSLFDPDGDYVVAYGKIESGHDIEAYEPFEITLEYKATNRKPTYIIVTGSASKYGDYFTGGNGAVLYLDDFELLYDY